MWTCKPPRWHDDPVNELCEMSNDDSWRHVFAYPLAVEPQQCIEPRGMFTVYAGLVWASSAECFTPDIPF